MKVTKEQVKSLIEVVEAVADTIKELKQVSSGHLYAQLMNYMSIDQYNQVIDFLKRSKLVKEQNNLLIWNLEENNV